MAAALAVVSVTDDAAAIMTRTINAEAAQPGTCTTRYFSYARSTRMMSWPLTLAHTRRVLWLRWAGAVAQDFMVCARQPARALMCGGTRLP